MAYVRVSAGMACEGTAGIDGDAEIVFAKEEDTAIPDVCVVHLVWVPLGIKPFRKFLSSYSAFRAGTDHDLLIVFNGFRSERELAIYEKMLSEYRCRVLLIRRPGLDIRSYFIVARTFRHRYFCFLNSYSRLLDVDWLLKMFSHLSKPGVGIVAATGSYESLYTNFVKGRDPITGGNIFKRLTGQWNQGVKTLKKKMRFDPFPNYHIRTNGFMISREVMLKARPAFILRKTDAYKFESGKTGLTKQVLKMGLKALVVDKNGRGYEKEEWHKAGTFRQGDQGNLLIADNQTDMYAAADDASKRDLSRRTWGDGVDVSLEGTLLHDH